MVLCLFRPGNQIIRSLPSQPLSVPWVTVRSTAAIIMFIGFGVRTTYTFNRKSHKIYIKITFLNDREARRFLGFG